MKQKQISIGSVRVLSLVMVLLVSGCIGENPDSKKTETPAATTQPAAPAATAPAAAAKPTTPTIGVDGKPIEFVYESNSFQHTLHHHYLNFSKDNNTLEQRQNVISAGGFDPTNTNKNLLDEIALWSNKILWQYSDGRQLNDLPPDNAMVTIRGKSGHHSMVAVDGKYSLEKLTLDDSCGVYVKKDGALLAQTIMFNKDAFAIVPMGRIGGQKLTMQQGSFMDLLGGDGCFIKGGLKDLKVEASNPKGVLTFDENGNVTIDSAYITAHKIEQLSTIRVSEAVFNLQPVTSGTMTNIEYLHKKGTIEPSNNGSKFFFKVNGLYKLQSDAKIRMYVYSEGSTTPRIDLNKQDVPATTVIPEDEKPSLNGKIHLKPIGEIKKTYNIVLINSNAVFSANTINNVSRLLDDASKTIGKHNFALKMSENNKQILLDITESSSTPLKATLPIQRATSTFRNSVFKASMLDDTPSQVLKLNVGGGVLFTSQYATSTPDTSAQSTVFGFKHQITTPNGYFDLQHVWGRARVLDDVYRYVPGAATPFWMVQNTFQYHLPMNFQGISVTPSAGLTHFAVPETTFQEGFQSVIPTFGVTTGKLHRMDTSSFEISFSVNVHYQHGIVDIHDKPFGINTGMNLKVQLPGVKLSASLINPFQTESEVYLSLGSDG